MIANTPAGFALQLRQGRFCGSPVGAPVTDEINIRPTLQKPTKQGVRTKEGLRLDQSTKSRRPAVDIAITRRMIPMGPTASCRLQALSRFGPVG